MSAVLLPGGVRQNGYIVHDLDASLAPWVAMGVGPWYTLRELAQTVDYRGTAVPVVISVAFAQAGDLQVELIQQHDDSPSAYREFLDTGRQGFHHLAWWAEDYEGALAAAAGAGWTVAQSGDGGGAARYAYFDAPAPGSGAPVATALELMELNALTRWMADTIRSGAEDWDGTDPVRPLF